MAKKRVHEVAKELGVPTKELIESLNGLGIEKTSNFSALEDDEVTKVTDFYNKSNGSAVTTTKEESSTPVEKPATESKKAAPETKPEPTKEEEKVAEVEEVVETAPVEETPAKDISDEVDKVVETESAEPETADTTESDVPAPNKKTVGKDPRPPVVAVLGHVDHGKTTLLDQIRSANVVDGEAGGITQAIGAYQIQYKDQKITFIDTPGHRAFTGMRARGAQVTDIVILVVAADDGIMEQTKEAIAHAKAAGVPIIIAINKIDKAGADPTRVKQQLSEVDLMTEEWGGSTITVDVSAINGEGIEDLLEMILLVSEVEELKADADAELEGTIIESHLDSSRGPVATAIIKNGTLRERDTIVAGPAHGRIRALQDYRGQRMAEAPPGTPVEILGLSEAPPVGGTLKIAQSPSKARKIADVQKAADRKARMPRAKLTWDQLMAKAEQKGVLKVVLKADSLGSLEALQNELQLLDTDEISLEILHSAVGGIGEGDVLLAASTDDDVIIFGFQVPIDGKAKEMADQENVTVRSYKIIYELIDDLRKAHMSLMDPEFREVSQGLVEIRQVYTISKIGSIAGCYVRSGVVKRNSLVRVKRGDRELFDGRLASLKRFEQDVREVTQERECGIKIEGFDDIEVGDVLEVYALEEIERF